MNGYREGLCYEHIFLGRGNADHWTNLESGSPNIWAFLWEALPPEALALKDTLGTHDMEVPPMREVVMAMPSPPVRPPDPPPPLEPCYQRVDYAHVERLRVLPPGARFDFFSSAPEFPEADAYIASVAEANKRLQAQYEQEKASHQRQLLEIKEAFDKSSALYDQRAEAYAKERHLHKVRYEEWLLGLQMHREILRGFLAGCYQQVGMISLPFGDDIQGRVLLYSHKELQYHFNYR